MNISGKSVIQTLVFASIVLMMSTLITAGAIACEALVNSAGTSSEQANSAVTNSEQANCGLSADPEQANCDLSADSEQTNSKSLADCQ